MDNLLKALAIFASYTDAPRPLACGQNILLVYVDPVFVSNEDKATLEALGFDVCHDEGLFYSYYYGSTGRD